MKVLLLTLIPFTIFAQMIKTESIDLGPLSKRAIKHLNEINLKDEELKETFKKLNDNFKKLDNSSKGDLLEIAITNKLLLNSQVKTGITNLTTSIIKKAQEKLKDNSDILTDFSKEVISKIIDDYLPYFEGGFLNRYESFSRNNQKELNKYLSLKSKLKFTSKWIHIFLNSSGEDFNQLCSNVIKEAFELSIDESYYIGSFTKIEPSNTSSFSLTQIQKDPPKKSSEQTLKSAVKGIDEDLLEAASEEIDKLKAQE